MTTISQVQISNQFFYGSDFVCIDFCDQLLTENSDYIERNFQLKLTIFPMFVRKLKHSNGKIYVQIVEKQSGKYRVLRSFGGTADENVLQFLVHNGNSTEADHFIPGQNGHNSQVQISGQFSYGIDLSALVSMVSY